MENENMAFLTNARKEELLTAALGYFSENSGGEEAYRFLHDRLGFTNSELVDCGMDKLRPHFRYEWADGSAQMKYAEILDNLLPRHDAYTTASWISLAEDLSEETSFEKEASLIVSAFRDIIDRFQPSTVETIYNLSGALLSDEFLLAAEDLENGVSTEEISENASNGYYTSDTATDNRKPDLSTQISGAELRSEMPADPPQTERSGR